MKAIVIVEASNEDELTTAVNAQLASLALWSPNVVGFTHSPSGYHVMIQYTVP